MDLYLDGLKALVTGGTGGLGGATVETLADEGCHVARCARGEEGVREAVAELESRGVTAFGRALDVADVDALTGWVADAADALGGIDIVVANVSALALGNDQEAWRGSFEVDLMHSVRTVEAALPHLKRSRPEEVGRAVTFLASPAASFISGTNLLVDGALTPAVQM